LIVQLIEDRFTCAQYIEAERGDLKAHAAGVARVCVACHVSAFLQDAATGQPMVRRVSSGPK
jgi:hypothetical protein